MLRFFYGQTFHDRLKKRKLNMTLQNAPSIVEIYSQQDRYNPRLRATVPGAWIAVYDNGYEVPLCALWEASTPDQARSIFNGRG
jgi:hypothetical protein